MDIINQQDGMIIIVVFLSSDGDECAEIPVTPDTTSADVISCCKLTGETECYLSAVIGSKELPLRSDQRIAEVIHQSGNTASFYLRHSVPADAMYQGNSAEMNDGRYRNSSMAANSRSQVLPPRIKPLSTGTPIYNLRDFAAQQQQEDKTNREKLEAWQKRKTQMREESRMKDARLAEERKRLAQLQDKIRQQEQRLVKIKERQHQIEETRVINCSLSTELDASRVTFATKEKEMADITKTAELLIAKIKESEEQKASKERKEQHILARIQRIKVEYERYKKLAHKQTEQFTEKRDALKFTRQTVESTDSYIAELWERVRQFKVGQKLMTANKTNVAAVGPYIHKPVESNAEQNHKDSSPQPTLSSGPTSDLDIKLLERHGGSGQSSPSINDEREVIPQKPSKISPSTSTDRQAARTEQIKPPTQGKLDVSGDRVSEPPPRPVTASVIPTRPLATESESVIQSVEKLINEKSPGQTSAEKSASHIKDIAPFSTSGSTLVLTAAGASVTSVASPSPIPSASLLPQADRKAQLSVPSKLTKNDPQKTSDLPSTKSKFSLLPKPTSPRLHVSDGAAASATPQQNSQGSSIRVLSPEQQQARLEVGPILKLAKPPVSDQRSSENMAIPSGPIPAALPVMPVTTVPMPAALPVMKTEPLKTFNSKPRPYPAPPGHKQTNSARDTEPSAVTVERKPDVLPDSTATGIAKPIVKRSNSQTEANGMKSPSRVPQPVRQITSDANKSSVIGPNYGSAQVQLVERPQQMHTLPLATAELPVLTSSQGAQMQPTDSQHAAVEAALSDHVAQVLSSRDLSSPGSARNPSPRYATRHQISNTYIQKVSPEALEKYKREMEQAVREVSDRRKVVPSPVVLPQSIEPSASSAVENYPAPAEVTNEAPLSAQLPTPLVVKMPEESSSLKEERDGLMNGPASQDEVDRSRLLHSSSEDQIKLPSPNTITIARPDKASNLRNEDSNHKTARVSFSHLALLLDIALEGDLELLRKILPEVADPSAGNVEGITPLHNAICAGHFDIVKCLVDFGCDINAVDTDGWTPLHCAASCNNLPVVEYLVEHGACVFGATISDQETAAEKCEEDEEGYDGCSQYLYQIQDRLGADNNSKVFALYDYEKENPDELSFTVGAELKILRRGDDQESEWWWARLGDQEGYVARNLLGLTPRVRQKYIAKA